MRLISLFFLAWTAYCADFTTYIGSASVNPSVRVAALATDSAGDTYVTGSNAFVTKLDPSGRIVFTMSLGPAGSYANAIAIDPAGNIWVGGQAATNSFPLVNALQSTWVSGGVGFLVKMTPDGTVIYSSYFGGTLGSSGVNGVATDQSGNVYVTGFTEASDFPTTAGLPASPVTGSFSAPVYGLFAAKLNSTGQKILYSTVIAGMNCDNCGTPHVPRTVGTGIAVDGSGNAIVAGDTNSTDLSVDSGSSSVPGAFVFKINAAGNELVYFNYLGSGASVGSFLYPDTAPSRPIAADASGNAYVAGYTNQGFVTKLSPAGATVWNAPLSGFNSTIANALSLDISDNVWLTGPGFVTELSGDGASFPYSEQFPSDDAGQDIAVDQSNVVHFAGNTGLISTLTPGQPLEPRVLSILNAASGTTTGLIAPGEVISIYGLGLWPTTGQAAPPDSGDFPSSIGSLQVLVNGSPIPLLYVSASQIDAEIPSGIASGGLTNGMAVVQVMNNSVALPDFTVAIVGSDFGVFENAGGSMAVMNQDGTLNKIANPAQPGTIATIWATGYGATGAPALGAVTMSANNFCSNCQLVLISQGASITETVQYAGTAPFLIDGLMQINFAIPQLPSGDTGAFVYFTPPGYSQPIQLGWVNIAP